MLAGWATCTSWSFDAFGPVSYTHLDVYKRQGTITVNNETGKRPYLGLQGLELVLLELQGRYPVRRST